MPCDSITLNTSDLKVANREVLEAALIELGATNILHGKTAREAGIIQFRLDGYIYQIGRGELTGYGDTKALSKRIVQAYGRTAVKVAAKRFGFQVKGSGNSLQLIKR